MIKSRIHLVFQILALLFCFSAAIAQEGTLQVSSVEIQGNKRIDSAAMKELLKAKPGSVKSSTINRDIKKLYETGFFDQVSAALEESGKKGGKILRFIVAEKPVVRKLFISGNKEVTESDLAEIIKLGGNRFLDRTLLNTLIKNAVLYYQSEGFYDVAIDYSVVPVDEGQVDLTFNVVEGERFKIRDVAIEGAVKADIDEVLSAIKTTRYKWWSSWILGTGRLNKDTLNADKTAIRQYLLDNGYVDASVADAVVEKISDGLKVSFFITEGDQYKLGDISVSGDLVNESSAETLDGIESKSGDTFNASQLREDTFKISEKFSDVGYAYVNVIPDTKIDKSEKTVGIVFKVDKGKAVSIDKIKIQGNDKTYDNVIRREMKIDEQDPYSGSKIRKSQERLQRLGYFEEVNITPEQTDQEDKVDLKVNVKEASTGTLSAGAGYSSSDGALFTTTLSENNLLGTGRRVALNLDIGSQRESKVLSYDDPRLNDTKWAFGADLMDTQREFTDFDRQVKGGALSLGYPLEEFFGAWAEDVSFSTRYEYNNIEISNVDLKDAAPLVIAQEGTSSASGLTPKLVRNTLNNPLNPTKGSQQEISIEGTGLGGSEDYYLFQAKETWYTPVFSLEKGEIVFSFRTKYGYGKSYDGEDLPLFRRFFPGGINSVRGYESRTLGPKDGAGNEFGGNKQFVNNFELIFPLVESAGLKAVVFYDAGQAFEESDPIKISDLRQAYGYGLRWTSPLGPIRIEFGFPIDKETGENSMVTLFSFGAPF